MLPGNQSFHEDSNWDISISLSIDMKISNALTEFDPAKWTNLFLHQVYTFFHEGAHYSEDIVWQKMHMHNWKKSIQWELQEPKLKVPTVYKAFIRPMQRNIPSKYGKLVQYFNFRILKFPWIQWGYPHMIHFSWLLHHKLCILGYHQSWKLPLVCSKFQRNREGEDVWTHPSAHKRSYA